VNDISFENMSNDEAVRVLKEVVQKPGYVCFFLGWVRLLYCWLGLVMQEYYRLGSVRIGKSNLGEVRLGQSKLG